MSDQIDIDFLELLSSKLCHDLISPVGAIANGVEFLEEMGGDAGPEVIDLISHSSQQASAKLKCYRMAYGAGGADTSIKPEDVHNNFEEYLGPQGAQRVTQDWDPHTPLGPEERPAGMCKMLMTCLILAIDGLPKGGNLTVKAGNGDDVIITATGENAGLKDDMASALNMEIKPDDLNPKLVHPYMAGQLAKNYGFKISLSNEEEQLTLTLNLSV